MDLTENTPSAFAAHCETLARLLGSMLGDAETAVRVRATEALPSVLLAAEKDVNRLTHFLPLVPLLQKVRFFYFFILFYLI